MDLYFSPMACSLAARIALYEADIPASFRNVELDSKQIEGGGDLRALSMKGLVPVLIADDGAMLTENVSVLQYIADLNPAAALAPAWNTPDRYALQSWLSYVATELHKQVLWVIFAPAPPEATKAFVKTLIPAKLAFLDAHLTGRTALVGDSFTVADAYLIWALALFRFVGADIDAHRAVAAYEKRMLARAAVSRAFSEERRLFAA
jgi:glutathione S-transferase